MSDYISREKAKFWIDKHIKKLSPFCTLDKEIKLIEQFDNDIPSADVRENIHGEWIVNMNHERGIRTCTCNRCGTRKIAYKNPNFCSNCGADMRGDT